MALVFKSIKGLISDAALIYKTIVELTISTQTVIIWLRNPNLSTKSKNFLALLKIELDWR